MSTSRRSRPGRTTRGRTTQRRSARPTYSADLQRLLAADAAEARGDPVAAMAVVEEHLLDHTGQPFWRPARIDRLIQLAELGGVLPRWATSRWILAQALQTLHPTNSSRNERAMRVASDLRSGTDRGSIDTIAAQARALDTDWVFRQAFLYELGGLELFLTQVASPDLLVGADSIREWAGVRMGGYRLVGATAAQVTWEDLAKGAVVVTANIGSHVMVVPGEHVIGRLVPTVEGPMFEAAPLLVPERVAQQVAHSPADWIEALDSARHHEDETIETSGFRFLLLTDVPTPVALLSVMTQAGCTRPADVPANLADFADDVRTFAHQLATNPPEQGLEDLDVWACLAAVILRPGLGSVFSALLTADDEETLSRLAAKLAEPAASVCRRLVTGLRGAA